MYWELQAWSCAVLSIMWIRSQRWLGLEDRKNGDPSEAKVDSWIKLEWSMEAFRCWEVYWNSKDSVQLMELEAHSSKSFVWGNNCTETLSVLEGLHIY
jgi:hypothetical protein